MRSAIHAATLAVLLGSGAVLAQQEPPVPLEQFRGEIQVTAVRVNVTAVDAEGEPVPGLAAADLEVLEDGQPVAVLALEAAYERPVGVAAAEPETVAAEAPTPWRVVAYASTGLAGRLELPSLLEQAAAQAAELTAMGPVDLILADPAPEVILGSTSSAAELAAALRRLAADIHPRGTVEQLRREFLRELEGSVASGDYFDAEANAAPGSQWTPTHIAARARARAREERMLVRKDLDRLVLWLQGRPSEKRGLLLWITGGFDLDPAEFYLAYVAQAAPAQANAMRLELASQNLRNELAQVIDVALAHGWTVVPMNAARFDTFLYDASTAGRAKAHSFAGPTASSIDAQPGTIARVQSAHALEIVAGVTGGEVVHKEELLAGALRRVRGSYFLTYQVDRPRDGKTHELQIRSLRSDVSVRAPRLVAGGTLEGAAAARAARVLSGEEERGALPVRAELSRITKEGKKKRLGQLELAVDLSEYRDLLARLGGGRMRVTILVEKKKATDGPPFVAHLEQALEQTGEGDTWYLDLPLKWNLKDHRLLAMVEELATGTWGTAEIELPR